MSKPNAFLRHALRVLPVSLLCATTTTVYAAVTLYCSNTQEFWFTLSQGLAGVWGVFTAAAVGLWLVLMLLPRRVRDIGLAAALWLGVSLLLQMTLLNADYGLMDGKAIDWGSMTVYGIINTVTWLAMLVICLKLRKAESFHRLAVLVPLLLLLAEGGHMAALTAALGDQTPTTTELQLTDAGLDTVGDDSLLLLILDSVDADDLTQALHDDPALSDALDGFTFYEAAMGLSDPTKYGLPALLTGAVHDQPEGYEAFLTRAYTDAPLFRALSAEGWDARVFTEDRYIDMAAAHIANAERKSVVVGDQDGLTHDLLQLCAFRYLPHLLKPACWMYGNVFGSYRTTEGAPIYQQNDPRYAATLAEGGLHHAAGRTFRAIHLVGMHPPYTMAADCTYHGEGVTPEAQMTGSMAIVSNYLSQLKALSAYDTADILILADHGTETVHRPMLLLKRKGQHGALTISEAPVSYADLNATYMKLLGQSTSAPALWEIDETTPRTRLYYHEQSSNSLFSLYQYDTTLLHPAFEALQATGEVYHADTLGAAPPYTLGSTLYFDLRATGRPYEISGFSSADHASTWTSGNIGELRLPLAALPQTDSVTVCMTFLSVMQGRQRLIVTCGGETVFSDTVTELHTAFTVPSRLLSDGAIDLCFTYPDAISHKDAGKSEDTRKVAFALVSLTVLEEAASSPS